MAGSSTRRSPSRITDTGCRPPYRCGRGTGKSRPLLIWRYLLMSAEGSHTALALPRYGRVQSAASGVMARFTLPDCMILRWREIFGRGARASSPPYRHT
jgi:hypothetical protein